MKIFNFNNEYSVMFDIVDHFIETSDDKVIFIADHGFTYISAYLRSTLTIHI